MSMGKNTIQSRRLLEIVEQSEDYDAQKKEISDLNSALMAAAKAEGFSTKAINHLKKRRKMKPHDRQEADELYATYEHAAGLDEEPPLFRAINRMATDGLGREQLLDSFKKLAPAEGDIILRIGGEPVRIWRDPDGGARSEPFVEKPKSQPKATPAKPTGASRPAREVPNVDDAGAYELGRQMYRDNRPVIDNPFPYGDPRRARCDEGYRHESGSDGMGPDD